MLPRPPSPTNVDPIEEVEDLSAVFDEATQNLEKVEKELKQLPLQQASLSPGFPNHRNRTCFANAVLKQCIASMSISDVVALQKKACTLYKKKSADLHAKGG